MKTHPKAVRRLSARPQIVLTVAFGLVVFNAGPMTQSRDAAAKAASAPQRIVSLAPSITEVLFAAGCGGRVIGVTSYCRYPAEATRLAKVGGYITPSYEAIAALHPDLIVLLPEHEDAQRSLTALGYHTLELDHRSIAGVLDSIRTIGERCGTRPQGDALLTELQGRLNRVADTIAGRPRPRVVISVARDQERGFGALTAAAPGGIHDDLLTRAGGRNALPPGPILHPALSPESLLRLNPDAIVELVPGPLDRERVRAEWHALSSLDAVRRNRVLVFNDDYLQVPGPRLVRFVERLAQALHPDARWRTP